MDNQEPALLPLKLIVSEPADSRRDIHAPLSALDRELMEKHHCCIQRFGSSPNSSVVIVQMDEALAAVMSLLREHGYGIPHQSIQELHYAYVPSEQQRCHSLDPWNVMNTDPEQLTVSQISSAKQDDQLLDVPVLLPFPTAA